MPGQDITTLLQAHSSGQDGALDKAFQIVYDELRRLASFQLRAQVKGHTLNTTSLVHEVYLKIVQSDRASAESHAHFLALASRAMRQIVIDYARASAASKRGGGAQRVPLDSQAIGIDEQASWLLDVEAALQHVHKIDPRLVAVFECRYFAGLSEEEAATALNVSLRTVQRDWRRAKAWIREYLSDDPQ